MHKAGVVRETHNPDASVAFIIQFPFQFFILKNIFNEMRARAEFIVDLGGYSVRPAPRLCDDIVRMLERHNVPYRVLKYDDYSYPTYLERFFEKYVALVSPWERGCVSLACNAERKKIHVVYGAGKDLNNARHTRGIYDVALSYGPHDHVLASYFTESVIVGNPKFDDWFSGRIDMSSVEHIARRLDVRKKTILYLPTHSDLSSIDALASSLRHAAASYNVIVKLHYFTPYEEPERAALFEGSDCIVCTDEVDLLPLLKLANVVISDNSSAIFDAILADIPVVVTDFLDEKYLDEEHKELRRYRRGMQGALTYSGSIEQRIKKDGSVIPLTTPDKLEEKIEEALRDAPHFKQRRAQLREQLFAFNDGTCARRARDAIDRTITNPAETKRPILYHVMEAYKRRLGTLSYGRERRLLKRITTTQRLLNQKLLDTETGTIFSVILCAEEGHAWENSLRGVIEQTFAPERYEIIVTGIPGHKVRETLSALPLSHRHTAVIATESDDMCRQKLGARLQAARSLAQGKVLCFTTSACVQKSHWLQSLYAAYDRYPNTGGVGGYVAGDGTERPRWEEYQLYRMARLFGVEGEKGFLAFLYAMESRLFRNPAGTVHSMSYRKDALPPDISFVHDVIELEYCLKLAVLEKHPICFLPIRAERMSLSLDAALQEERARGMRHHLAKKRIERAWKYEGQSFIKILGCMVRAAMRYRDIRMGWMAGRVECARWKGEFAGVLILVGKQLRRYLNSPTFRENQP
jgi:hypothetical protein